MDYMLSALMLVLGVGFGCTVGFMIGVEAGRRREMEENPCKNPMIDIELLASIPGIKIKGPGIDIDTTEMRDLK